MKLKNVKQKIIRKLLTFVTTKNLCDELKERIGVVSADIKNKKITILISGEEYKFYADDVFIVKH